MPFPLGEPFSVENSSADLLHFPPWRALGRVEGFVGGRELENATDPHRLRLETILHSRVDFGSTLGRPATARLHFLSCE